MASPFGGGYGGGQTPQFGGGGYAPQQGQGLDTMALMRALQGGGAPMQQGGYGGSPVPQFGGGQAPQFGGGGYAPQQGQGFDMMALMRGLQGGGAPMQQGGYGGGGYGNPMQQRSAGGFRPPPQAAQNFGGAVAGGNMGAQQGVSDSPTGAGVGMAAPQLGGMTYGAPDYASQLGLMATAPPRAAANPLPTPALPTPTAPAANKPSYEDNIAVATKMQKDEQDALARRRAEFEKQSAGSQSAAPQASAAQGGGGESVGWSPSATPAPPLDPNTPLWKIGGGAPGYADLPDRLKTGYTQMYGDHAQYAWPGEQGFQGRVQPGMAGYDPNRQGPQRAMNAYQPNVFTEPNRRSTPYDPNSVPTVGKPYG